MNAMASRIYQLIVSDFLLIFINASTLFLLLLAMGFAYLAVKYRRLNDRMSARWKRLEADWDPLLVAVLAGDQPPETVWSHVGQQDRLFFIDLLGRYAKRVRGEATQKIAMLAKPFLESVVNNLRRGAPAQRARAVQSLGQLAFDLHAEDIVKALDDESPLVAMIAARTLSQAEHPQHIKPVIDRLYRFENWSPKFLASMLATVGPEAAPTLREAYADRTKPSHSRAVAAEALRWLQDIASAEIAAEILEEEKSIYIAGLDPAQKARRIDEEARRQEARKSAVSPQGPPMHEPTHVVELEEDAYTHFQDPHRDLIASTLRLLRNLGRPEHAGKVRIFRDAKDFVLRSYAVRALGRLGDAEDLPALIAAFDDPSMWVGLHAARAIKELGGAENLTHLIESNHPRSDIARQVLAEAAA